MNSLVDDIKKFRELLNQTPKQLNEMFDHDQKKDGLPENEKPVYTDHDFSGVERAVRPIYQRVQGLVPSFADPVRSYLLQAQKSLLAALEFAEKKSVKENDYSDLEEDEMVTENQKVQILGWNSTKDGNIDNWAKDKESFRDVMVDKLTMDSMGRPVLYFMELDGSGPYQAVWNQKHGWAADFA